jgi:hypothetical protein
MVVVHVQVLVGLSCRILQCIIIIIIIIIIIFGTDGIYARILRVRLEWK